MALWRWNLKPVDAASFNDNDAGMELRELMTEARRQSLEDVMTATLTCSRDMINKKRGWAASDETREVERRIESIYQEVLSGRGKLMHFRAACENWQWNGQFKN